MDLKEMLAHRRAIRVYDKTKHIDTERVADCLRLAQLAPTSSNMQLWECYHVTDAKTLEALHRACFQQTAATTAQELVVFVVRPNYVKRRATANLTFQERNIREHFPKEKQEKYLKRWSMYYKKAIPFLYGRFFGLFGLLRKGLMQLLTPFRPMLHQTSEADGNVILHKSCALVAETFMLAMSEIGYDTCPLEGFDSWRVKRALHLPFSAQISMIVSCGIRDEATELGERFRIPFEEQYFRI